MTFSSQLPPTSQPTAPTYWFLITLIGLPSHHCLNQPSSEHEAWEQSVLLYHVVCHNLSLFRAERHWVLYVSLWPSHRLAWVTTRPRGGAGNKSLLDLQAWITTLNQSGRHFARTSKLWQPAPASQLPWFPAHSSPPACARLPAGLNSGVRI